jgi:hypothetical protein
LTLSKSGTDLAFNWGASGCSPSGYGVYRGDLAALQAIGVYSHDTALACGVAGTTFSLPIADAQLGDRIVMERVSPVKISVRLAPRAR